MANGLKRAANGLRANGLAANGLRRASRANGLLANSVRNAKRAANGLMATGAVQWLVRNLF